MGGGLELGVSKFRSSYSQTSKWMNDSSSIIISMYRDYVPIHPSFSLFIREYHSSSSPFLQRPSQCVLLKLVMNPGLSYHRPQQSWEELFLHASEGRILSNRAFPFFLVTHSLFLVGPLRRYWRGNTSFDNIVFKHGRWRWRYKLLEFRLFLLMLQSSLAWTTKCSIHEAFSGNHWTHGTGLEDCSGSWPIGSCYRIRPKDVRMVEMEISIRIVDACVSLW